MSNLQEGKIVLEGTPRVKISNDEFEKFYIKKYDLIFNRTNSFDLVGKTALAIDDMSCVFASYLVRFSLNGSSAHPLFVAYYFNQHDAISRLKILATPGVSQCNINPTTLKRHFYLPLPPLPEQKKIAEILSTWDRAIEQVGKLIDAKQRLKKGLMQQLLTGRMRFPEFGKPVKEKGELPEGWRKIRLKKIAVIDMGTSPSSKSYNEVGNGIPLIQGNADICNRKTFPSRWTTEITTECFPGDLIMTVRAPVGEIALSEHHACVGRGACVLKPQPETDKNFLFQLLISTERKWKRFAQGSTFTCLTGEDIRNYKFVLPNLKEQIRIASLLSTCDKEIELLKKKQEKLKEQKKGLMQKLLTGEIRHPNFLKGEYMLEDITNDAR